VTHSCVTCHTTRIVCFGIQHSAYGHQQSWDRYILSESAAARTRAHAGPFSSSIRCWSACLPVHLCRSVSQCVAVCRSVVQCGAVRHDPFICARRHSRVTWLIHVWHYTPLAGVISVLRSSAYKRNDPFIYKSAMCDGIASYVTWRFHTRHITSWYVGRVSLKRVTWIIHMWHVFFFTLATQRATQCLRTWDENRSYRVTWLNFVWHDACTRKTRYSYCHTLQHTATRCNALQHTAHGRHDIQMCDTLACATWLVNLQWYLEVSSVSFSRVFHVQCVAACCSVTHICHTSVTHLSHICHTSVTHRGHTSETHVCLPCARSETNLHVRHDSRTSNVVQCVAACCSMLQCVETHICVLCMTDTSVTHLWHTCKCDMTREPPMCCSVLQCVAACCSVLQRVAVFYSTANAGGSIGMLQRAAVWCSVLHCAAVCCSVMQRVSVCFRVLQGAVRDTR